MSSTDEGSQRHEAGGQSRPDDLAQAVAGVLAAARRVLGEETDLASAGADRVADVAKAVAARDVAKAVAVVEEMAKVAAISDVAKSVAAVEEVAKAAAAVQEAAKASAAVADVAKSVAAVQEVAKAAAVADVAKAVATVADVAKAAAAAEAAKAPAASGLPDAGAGVTVSALDATLTQLEQAAADIDDPAALEDAVRDLGVIEEAYGSVAARARAVAETVRRRQGPASS